MFDNAVTRNFPGQVNHRDTALMSDLYVQDRISRIHEFVQDFDDYTGPATTAGSPAGGYTLAGAGGTAALTAGDGGLLLLSAAASTFASLQKTPADYVLAKTFRTWFQCRVVLDSIVGNIITGLLNATATPFTGASQTDGAYFLSVVTTGALTFNIAVGGVITSVNCGVSLVAGSQAHLQWYYDGAIYAAGQPNGRVVWEVSGPGVTAPARGEIFIAAASTFPGATGVVPTIGVNAPTAVIRTATVDLLWAGKDRTNPNASPIF